MNVFGIGEEAHIERPQTGFKPRIFLLQGDQC